MHIAGCHVSGEKKVNFPPLFTEEDVWVKTAVPLSWQFHRGMYENVTRPRILLF